MDLGPYIDNIQQQLAVAAEAGGEEARALAQRLSAPLDAAIRLTLHEVLAAAAEEITVELAPGSVEVRLRGRDPEFVVTPPTVGPSAEEPEGDEAAPSGRPAWSPVPAADGEEGTISRINLRLPNHLKARIEQAAGSEGISVN